MDEWIEFKDNAELIWRRFRKKPLKDGERLLHHTLEYHAGVMGRNGWQDISFSVDRTMAYYHISDIGDDGRDFVDFVCRLAPDTEAVFSWSLEPGSYDWYFSRRDELLYVEIPHIPKGIFIRYDDFVRSIREDDQD